jgi:hypothetical protein
MSTCSTRQKLLVLSAFAVWTVAILMVLIYHSNQKSSNVTAVADHVDTSGSSDTQAAYWSEVLQMHLPQSWDDVDMTLVVK